jgi:ABC-type spermidine/putrescine transport system permease subunit II
MFCVCAAREAWLLGLWVLLIAVETSSSTGACFECSCWRLTLRWSRRLWRRRLMGSPAASDWLAMCSVLVCVGVGVLG